MWKLFPHEPKFALYITALFKSVCHFLERIPQSCCAGCKLLQLSTPPLLKCRCAFTLLHRTYASSTCVPSHIYFKAEVQNSHSKYLRSDRNNMLPSLAGTVRCALLPADIPNLRP